MDDPASPWRAPRQVNLQISIGYLLLGIKTQGILALTGWGRRKLKIKMQKAKFWRRFACYATREFGW